MRKLLILILVLCLCGSVAAAETAAEGKILELPEGVNYVSLDRDSGRLIVEDGEKDVCWLADTDLNRLSGDYLHISGARHGFFEFETEDKFLTGNGLMDADGNVIVPADYADVESFGGKWAAGILVKLATKDDYDYTSYGSGTSYFIIVSVDFYYAGEKVGTLSREDWAYAEAYGDYLMVRTRSGKTNWYSPDFVKAESKSSFEYEDDSEKGVVIHSGSGRTAFSPDCTLTEAEVGDSIRINPDMQLVDLKGNVLADFSSYSSASLDGYTGLILLYGEDGKNGIADRAGNVLVPAVYEYLWPSENSVLTGYVRAIKDGKEGFVSLATGAGTGFTYDAYSGNSNDLFFWKDDPDNGGVLLVCPGTGELPERFETVDDYEPYMLVKQADGTIRLLDVNGADVLPADADLSGYISVSGDGSVILLQNYNDETYESTYTIFTVGR